MQRSIGLLAGLFFLTVMIVAPGSGEEGSTVLEEVEPNDSSGTAQKLPATCTVTGSVKATRDTDWFEVRFEEPAFLRAEVTGVEGVDFVLSIHDARNRRITHLDGQGPGRPVEILKRLRRGVYRLAVAAKAAKTGLPADTAYTLSVEGTKLDGYEPPTSEIKSAIRKGLIFLQGQQEEDGSFHTLKGKHGVSGLALMGYVGENLPEFKETMVKAAEYFKASYIAPGTYSRSEHKESSLAGSLVGKQLGAHFMYEQAIAVLAMAEYVHLAGDEKAKAMVAEGVKLLLRSQNSSARPKALHGPVAAGHKAFGGWRYTPQDKSSDLSVSGWCLIALAAAREAGFTVPENLQEDFMKYCRRCFSEQTGAYAYTPEGRVTNTTNAVGVLTTLMCVGGKCDVVRIGLRMIRANFPNWEVEGERGRYPFYYWYYASRAMYVAGGDHWKQWQAAILPMLLKRQNEDGSWDAALDEAKVGVEYTTAVAVLILQLCSGNPPAYLKGLELKVENYPCPKLVDDIEKLIDQAARDSRSKEELIKQIRALMDRYYGE